MSVSICLSASTLSRSAFGILAKASSVGANTVMASALLSVSTRPAFFTAVTSVDRACLLEAAVATGSSAMPSKEPAPSCGTEEQAGPNGSSVPAMSPPLPADGSSGVAGAEEAAWAESDEPLSPSSEQAARDRGRTAAATTATAERRIRAFMDSPDKTGSTKPPRCGSR